MNAWPTLKEWFQFSGTLALELIIVFAVVKLLALRIHSAQWRRALWQIAALAMLLITIGELNGVRNWMRLPPKVSPTVSEKRFIVTLEDVPPDLNLFSESFVTKPPPTALQRSSASSKWQRHVTWPAWVWLAGIIFFAARMMIAQAVATAFRFSSARVEDVSFIERAAEVIRTLGLCRSVRLLASARISAPFTFGVWRPVIILPQNFGNAFTLEQQDAALAHELAHVARFDSAWRCFAQFTCAILWWHPIAWLTKSELDHASELVADESSLFLVNGPHRLAECLVACAKEMRRPAISGWLGMDGGGFRSGLGKRVARLLQLNPHARISRPVPRYVRLIAPVFVAALLWVGMAATMHSSGTRGDSWRTSILGSAFAAAEANAVETKAKVKPMETNHIEVARLVQEGKMFYEVGRLAEARTNLLEALRLDPTNQGALYFLDLVEARQFAMRSRLLATNAFTSPARQEIYGKLRSIRLQEWGPLDGLPLSEVVRVLSQAARKNDPEHKGVNFIISPNAIPRENQVDAAGLPITATDPPVDLNAVTVHLGAKLNDLSLEEVLNILEKIADRKIKYFVEDFGVIISPGANEATPLHTRFFRLEPVTLQSLLRHQMTNSPETKQPEPLTKGGARETNSEGGIRFLTDVTPAANVIPALKNFFAAAGVDLSAPGKAIFFNDRLGLLMVRATLKDLDAIEKTLRVSPMKPGELQKVFPALPRDKTNAPPTTTETNADAVRVIGDLPYFGRFFRRAADTEQLEDTAALPMRRFNVDSNTLVHALRSVCFETSAPSRSGGRLMNAAGVPMVAVSSKNDTTSMLKSFFKAAGVNLDAPGKDISYSGAESLMVRGTPEDFDLVAKALQILIPPLQQLTIRMKVMEVEQTNVAGFDWFLGSTRITNRVVNQSGSDVLRPSGVFPDSQTNLLTSGVRQPASQPVQSVTGILNEEQFRFIIRALEQRGKTDLLSAPEITTLSGRQAQIKVVDLWTNQFPVTNSTAQKRDAEPVELGVTIDVIPYVEPDGVTIQMTVLPTVRDFLGYEDPGTFQTLPATGGPFAPKNQSSPTPIPKFRVRQLASSTRLFDGQTLVITSATNEKVNNKPKNLIFFITPRLIDPAGNPIHKNEELPFYRKVPEQKPAASPR